MQPSWDDGLAATVAASVTRRLRLAWRSEMTMDEVVSEVAACPRCAGTGETAMCGLCEGTGALRGVTTAVVIGMAKAAGLPEDRSLPPPHCPDEAAIRLACAKIRAGWSPRQVDAALRGIMPCGGDNASGTSEDRSPPRRPDAQKR